MTRPDDTRDLTPRRDDGAGLLVLVVAILAGTAWTVGSFLESSPVSAHATATPAVAPAAATFAQEDCVDCDEHTLAPLPGWHSAAIAPDLLLRASGTDRPEGESAVERRRAGVLVAPWMRVSAPAASDVSG